MNFDGWDLIKEKFNELAGKYDPAAGAMKLVRIAAAGGKAAAEKAGEELPAQRVAEFVDSFYGILTSNELAEGLSAAIQSLDEEKVKGLIDQVVAPLKTEEGSMKAAKEVKDLLSKASNSDIEAAIDEILNRSGADAGKRMVTQIVFQQVIAPQLDTLRESELPEVAAFIREKAEALPTEDMAAQVAAFTREFTPDRVSGMAQEIVGKLPSGADMGNMVRGATQAAADAFDAASKATTPAEARAAFGSFADRLQARLQNLPQTSVPRPKKPVPAPKRKKGGRDFN